MRRMPVEQTGTRCRSGREDNQNDVEERGNQVKITREIFHRAYGVWVWLGPEADQSDLAMDVIDELQLFPEEIKGANSRPVKWFARLLSDPACESQRQALHSLFRRSYWRRLWIVQEVVIGSCGNMPVICCGRRMTVLGQIFKLVRGICYLQHQLTKRAPGFEWISSALEAAKQLVEAAAPLSNLADHAEEYSNEERPGLLQILYRYSKNLCSDPRDKVYGLLGVTGYRFSDLTVDYTLSTAEVYWRITCLIIQYSNRLDLLSHCGLTHTDFSINKSVQVPSWVPDWSQDLGGSNLAPRFRSHIAFRGHRSVGDIEIIGKYLQVHAVRFGKVIGISQIEPSEPSISEENHIMHLLQLLRRVHGDHPQDDNFQDLTSINSLYDILFCGNESESTDPPNVRRGAFISWCKGQLRGENTKQLGSASSIRAAVCQPRRKLFIRHQAGLQIPNLKCFDSWWRGFGSCLAEVCEGDAVALVQGCDYPMLLRPIVTSSHSTCDDVPEYKVVGECFHSGIEVHTDLYIQKIRLG
jgi:hypothetical protein